MALAILLCLANIVANVSAAVTPDSSPAPTGCTPTTQAVVAPGDIINLKGPDVAADQAALGITWDYSWTVYENDANGKNVQQSTGQNFAFTVPTANPAKNYYIDLMVTAHQAQLCINEACMVFPIVKPGPFTITAPANQASQICVSDTGSYSYTSSQDTPSQVNQRWWIFPLANLPSDPSTLGYNDQGTYHVGDGNSISVNWNTVSQGKSGTYVILSAYYAKKSPYVYQGSAQMRTTVVGVPSSTITVT